jgi:hypothetical protein
MVSRLCAFVAFLIVFCFTSPNSVYACLCDTSTFSEAYKEAPAVFRGKFIGEEYRKGIVNESIEMTFPMGEQRREYEILVYKFQVDEWWKGGLQKEIILVTDRARFSDGGTSVSDCDSGFTKGRRYLIYAYYDEKNNLQTGACTRTARLSRAKNDLRLLGKGKKPIN